MRNQAVLAMALVGPVAPAALGQCPPELIHSPLRWHYAQFGRHVQIAGDVAAVSDTADHTFCPATTCNSGAVHIYRRAGGVWEFEATLFHSRISPYDAFGGAIAMDGAHRLSATAGGEDAAGPDTGAVYIFKHDGEAWREVAEILPVEPAFLSGFGGSLALHGDTLVVGQPKHNLAWIYREIDGRWEFSQKIAPPDPRLGAQFSKALALDDGWLIVGARLDDEGGHHAGAVYIYRREFAGELAFVRKVLAPGDPWNQVFGDDVAIDDGRMAVGAANGPEAALGAVYVFELTGGEWLHAATLKHDDPVFKDALGSSVALHGASIVAGAPRHEYPGGFGAAYAFRRQPDGSWRQAAKLLPEVYSGGDFGDSVAMNGASVIAGSPFETVGGAPSTGAAHIFDLACLLCRADLDGDGELTFLDFLAFQNLFAAGDPRADFDGDGALTFFDFLAFQNEFAAGCR